MSVRKNLSSVVVFSSVFLGSILSEGINIITTPNSLKDLFRKLQGTIDVVRESVKEKTDDATILLIESSTVAITRTKMKMENFSSVASRFKSNSNKVNTKANSSDFITNLKISVPKSHVIDIIDINDEKIENEILDVKIKEEIITIKPIESDATSEIITETKPKARKKKTPAIKTDSATFIESAPVDHKTTKSKTAKPMSTKAKTAKKNTIDEA